MKRAQGRLQARPWPRVFGFHEIFRCGTVAGYACHMVAIYMVIVNMRTHDPLIRGHATLLSI